MDLGSVIKDIRRQKGFTQKKFAEVCSISQTYLSQIESNRKEPNISILKVIAENLRLPLPVLFFKALNSDDIPESKKNAFDMVSPSFNSLIDSIFENDKKN